MKRLLTIVMGFLMLGALPGIASASVLYSQTVDSALDSTTLFNTFDCDGSGGAKCRFQTFQATANDTLTSVEFSFSPVGGGAGTVKACLYSTTDLATIPTGAPLICSTADSTANTTHKQTYTFTTPYTVVSGQYYAVSMEIQTGGDLGVQGASASQVNGTCYLRPNSQLSCNLADLYYVISGNAGIADACVSGNTRICNFTPAEGEWFTTNLIDFSLQAYISPDDMGTFSGIKITFRNLDQNTILGDLTSFLDPNDITFLSEVSATSSGQFNFATSSVPIGNGNYRVHVELIHSYLWGLIVNPFTIISADHEFVVVEETFIGHISQQSFGEINSLFASSTATSTSVLSGSCNVLSGFSINNCLAYLFIPDAGMVADSLRSFRDGSATHFPLGYLTDFIKIMSTTTASTLTVIDATLPSVLPGGGAHITLSLTGILDSLLNSTTTIFNNTSAPSTQTFYEITSHYWDILLYIATVFYIVARILGTHIVPELWHMNTNTQDRHAKAFSSAEAERYRYKEWLYNNTRK